MGVALCLASPLYVRVGYLCELDANVYGIDFVRFHVRDMNSNATLFEVKKSADDKSAETSRFVKYLFPPQFLELATLGAT